MDSENKGDKNIMFLSVDIIGAASKITYGLKGNEVTVLKDYDSDFKLVENNGVKFLVHNDSLSETKINANENKEDSLTAEASATSAKSVQRMGKAKRRR